MRVKLFYPYLYYRFTTKLAM